MDGHAIFNRSKKRVQHKAKNTINDAKRRRRRHGGQSHQANNMLVSSRRQ